MSITIKKLTIQLQLQELFQSALVAKLQFCSNKVNKVVPVCLDRLTSHFAWISRLQLIENSIKESHFVPKWSICGISIKILHTRDRQINCKKTQMQHRKLGAFHGNTDQIQLLDMLINKRSRCTRIYGIHDIRFVCLHA